MVLSSNIQKHCHWLASVPKQSFFINHHEMLNSDAEIWNYLLHTEIDKKKSTERVTFTDKTNHIYMSDLGHF